MIVKVNEDQDYKLSEEEVKNLPIEDEEVYLVNVKCDNCSMRSKVAITKGQSVSDSECPDCSCQTLKKLPVDFKNKIKKK